MSIAIADHIRDIPRSGIRDFFEIVQSMEDVISLGIGETYSSYCEKIFLKLRIKFMY